MICERCSRDIYKYETCDYCKKKICAELHEELKRISKTTRQVICKDCWSIHEEQEDLQERNPSAAKGRNGGAAIPELRRRIPPLSLSFNFALYFVYMNSNRGNALYL